MCDVRGAMFDVKISVLISDIVHPTFDIILVPGNLQKDLLDIHCIVVCLQS